MSINVQAAEKIRSEIVDRAYAFIPSTDYSIPRELKASQAALWESWSDLPPDNYIKGNHRFRFRRYSRYLLQPEMDLELLPHVAFFQSAEINHYAGGIAREFAPLETSIAKNQFLRELILSLFNLLPIEPIKTPWEIDVHQYRIIGEHSDQGLPTPEGIHNDGFDFFSVHLIQRENVTGGVSTIYDNDKAPIQDLTLEIPMDSILVQDTRVMHAVSPISPKNPSFPAVRDVLVVNFISQPRN